MLRKVGIYLSFVSVILSTSCETDFSLNGDYEITPVIFGLVDHKTNAQIFKITKAFLGDGDNLVYAQNPDSNYFNTVDAVVSEYKNGNYTGRSWQLHDSTIYSKDTSGIFYAPEQKIYVFYAKLDSSCSYKFSADLDEGAFQVEGETEMIRNFYLSSSVLLNKNIAFAPDNVPDDLSYSNWTFQVFEGTNGSTYTYKLIADWTDYYSDGSSQNFTATYNNGTKEQANPQSPQSQVASYRGVDFYTWLEQIVPDPTTDLTHRFLTGISIRISAAHYELDQYMDVAKPVTSIAQTQPEYTNLSGGLGLFSSRAIFNVSGFKLNKPSRQELCRGQHTGGKAFFSNDPADATEDWYWP